MSRTKIPLAHKQAARAQSLARTFSALARAQREIVLRVPLASDVNALIYAGLAADAAAYARRARELMGMFDAP